MKDSLHSDVRTRTGGLHQILPNGDLFIEESNYGRNSISMQMVLLDGRMSIVQITEMFILLARQESYY